MVLSMTPPVGLRQCAGQEGGVGIRGVDWNKKPRGQGREETGGWWRGGKRGLGVRMGVEIGTENQWGVGGEVLGG